MLLRRFLPAAPALLLAACQPDHAPATATPPAPPPAPVAPPAPPAATTRARPVAPRTMPRTMPPALHQLIREQVARLDAVRQWSAVREVPLDNPAEGGAATYYSLDGQLRKVVAHYYGETGQTRTDYYLLRGRPSFVREASYRYNRPIYYDARAMRDNHDTEAFDFRKSDSTLTRSYFDAAGQLVAQTGPVARDSARVAGYLAREQARLRRELDSLRQLARSPRP